MTPPALLGGADRGGRCLRLDRLVVASAGQVWRALTEPGAVAEWLGRVADGRPEPGGHFALWHDETTRSEHDVSRWEPGRVLGLTWDFTGETLSHVELKIAAAEAGSWLAVAHSRLDDPVAYAAGWHLHLDYLTAHLAGDPRPFAAFWDEYENLATRYAATAT